MPLTCDADSLAEAAKCFQNYCVNEADRLAIGVLLKAYQLKTASGTDYTTDLDLLIADSVGLLNITNGLWTLSAEEVALLLDATSGSPSTVEELLVAVACLRCQPLKVLRAAFMFLDCAITAEA